MSSSFAPQNDAGFRSNQAPVHVSKTMNSFTLRIYAAFEAARLHS